MPKKGDRLPWRVLYSYPPGEGRPDGIKGSKACYRREDAEIEAYPIARRGATVEIENRDTGERFPFVYEPEDDQDE